MAILLYLMAFFPVAGIVYAVWQFVLKPINDVETEWQERPIPMTLLWGVLLCPLVFVWLLPHYSKDGFKYGCVWLFVYFVLLNAVVNSFS